MFRFLTAQTSLALFIAAAGPRVGAQQEATTPSNASGKKVEELLKKDESQCILIEPRLMRSSVFVPIPTAKETGFVAARMTSGQMTPYGRKEFRSLRVSWKTYFANAVETAGKHLDALEPEYQRDENNAIVYGLLVSPSPLTASTILSPKFHKRFERVMGPRFYVAVPDRNHVFIFPKSNRLIPLLQDVVVATYKFATYPASLELFEISEDGIRIVGKFGET